MKSTITLTIDVEHEEGDGALDENFSETARLLAQYLFKKKHEITNTKLRLEPNEPPGDKYWADGVKHPEFCDERCYPYGCSAMDREDWEELHEGEPWPGDAG